METAFGYLFNSLFMFAFFYGFYHLIRIIPFAGPANLKSEVGTIEAVFMGALGCYFSISFFLVVLVILIPIAVVTYFVFKVFAVMSYFMFKGFIFIFSEAWKYFTIDVELVDAPV